MESATTKEAFGQKNHALEPTIIGGSDAERNQFPYIVSLHFLKRHVCGGSIVSQNWVVTAAHCCDKRLFMFCKRFTVIAGMLNQKENHPDIQRVGVQKDILHPNYFYSGGKQITLFIILTSLTYMFSFSGNRQ